MMEALGRDQMLGKVKTELPESVEELQELVKEGFGVGKFDGHMTAWENQMAVNLTYSEQLNSYIYTKANQL